MSDIEQALKSMEKDGGEWRKVEFWTKDSTTKILTQINQLDGVADVAIYKSDFHQNLNRVKP